jgi:hypothetical protein
MIARQDENVPGKPCERRCGECDPVVAVGAVDAEITVHDDRIGVVGVREIARDAPIVPEEPVDGRQMNMRQNNDMRHRDEPVLRHPMARFSRNATLL